jgi:hypothetical protein
MRAAPSAIRLVFSMTSVSAPPMAFSENAPAMTAPAAARRDEMP